MPETQRAGGPDEPPETPGTVRGVGSDPGRFGRRGLLIGGAAALGGAVVAGGSKQGRAVRPPGDGPIHADADPVTPTLAPGFVQGQPPGVTQVTLPSGVVVPVAAWLLEENEKPGTIDWIVTGQQEPHAIEGFASQVSAQAGDTVAVCVNTTARTVALEAYRMGYYQGLGGRLVYRSGSAPGQAQPAATVDATTGMVSCPWRPTFTLDIDTTWPPGCYLLKLVGTGGEQQYVPLTVRDDTSTAAFVIQNSVTTWQAYNLWNGYSLYYGPDGKGGQDFANRARIVSFDRPYPHTWAQGCADFLGNEFPLLYHLESYGIDLTYWTDVDLHQRPQLLTNHRCLFSLGHDEYWSKPMRDAAVKAVAAGVNIAFLGANACYRQIRLQASPNGPDRQQICYKTASEDPLLGVQDTL